MKTWHQRIEEAWQYGEFTVDDVGLAGNWVTCACGEQDPRIPRDRVWNAPIDSTLEELGYSFWEAVGRHNVREAAELLQQIKTRAKQVLDEATR